MPKPSLAASLLLAILALIVTAAPAVAQDAADPDVVTTPADAGQEADIASSAWLLPFESVTRFPPEPVSLVIILLSFVAVTLIIQAALRARRQVLLPDEADAQIEELIRDRKFRELIEFTEQDDSFVSRALNPALKRAPSFTDMRESLEAGVADETAEEFRRLEYINILANVGPLLGLLGTVVGIMDAFLAMQKAGGQRRRRRAGRRHLDGPGHHDARPGPGHPVARRLRDAPQQGRPPDHRGRAGGRGVPADDQARQGRLVVGQFPPRPAQPAPSPCRPRAPHARPPRRPQRLLPRSEPAPTTRAR